MIDTEEEKKKKKKKERLDKLARLAAQARFRQIAGGGHRAPDITAPTITSSATPTSVENVAISHTLTANEAVTWTKTGGADAALFTLVGNTLSMTAKNFEIPTDANTDNAYVVQVTATDAALNATNQTITFTITDADEVAPTITSSNAVNLVENVALSYTLTANETVTWTITGGADAAFFTVVGGGPVDGTLSMTAKDFEAPVDAGANNTYVVQVTATDAAGNATNQTITVTVTDVGDYSAEANALFARMTVQPSIARKVLYNDYINALKSAGIWAKMDAVYRRDAHDAQAAKLNLIADAYNLTEVNSPAFVADQGFTGDGATSYLDTGLNPVSVGTPKFGTNSASLMISSNTNLTDVAYFDIGNANAMLNARSSTALRGAIGDVTLANFGSNANSLGEFGLNRSAAGAREGYAAGSALGNDTQAATAHSNNTITLCAAQAASLYSLRQGAGAAIGQSLTAGEWAAFNTAGAAYKAGLATTFAFEDLFTSGETGVIIKPWDLSTQSQLTSGTAVTTTGQSVGKITSSVNGHVMISNDSTARPTIDITGSEYSLLFDGSNDYLEDADGLLPLSTFYAIFGVLGVATVVSANNRFFIPYPAGFGNDYNSLDAISITVSDGTYSIGAGGGTGMQVLATGATLVKRVIELVKTPTILTVYIDGVSVGSDSSFTAMNAMSGGGFGFGTSYVGGAKGRGMWHGKCYGVVWTSRAVSAGERASALTLMAAKQGRVL